MKIFLQNIGTNIMIANHGSFSHWIIITVYK